MSNFTVAYVADTHALFWYLAASPRLGDAAHAAFDAAAQGAAVIYIPAIVLAELYFLNEKYGRPLDFVQEFARLARSGQFVFVDFAAQDVLHFDMDAAVPEMHDRIVVGVARRLGVACLTCDEQIMSSGLVTVVW